MRKGKLIGLLAMLSMVVILAVAPTSGAAEPAALREFVITAQQFEYAPNIIRVNKGDRVKITLEATDVMHGFYLDGYGINLKSWEHQSDTAEFVADKTGKFRFRCSQTCGPLHPFMIGELIVEPNSSHQVSVVFTLLTIVGTLVYVWARKEGD